MSTSGPAAAEHVDLPRSVTFEAVLALANTIRAPNEHLELIVHAHSFFRPGGVALLCALLLERKALGRATGISGAQLKLDHLVRLGLYAHLSLEAPPLPKGRPAAGRYIPLTLISTGEEVVAVTNAICDLMVRRYDGAREFVPAVEWMTYEVVDNIVLHAQSLVPGVVCAQYYEASSRLEIAVVDLGRGLAASLSETREVADDLEALRLAVTKGVTRDAGVGQGNGLAGTLEIARTNGGTLQLFSGEGLLQQVGTTQSVASGPHLGGTGIVLDLDTLQPVNLADTQIVGDGGWHGWSYLIAEGERLTEAGGLRILDECVHVAGRAPAEALRRKIEVLLPDLETPLLLDFGGIRIASSSFLDELLGRLVATHGREVLEARLQIVNMQPLIQQLADSVIEQRLAGSLGS